MPGVGILYVSVHEGSVARLFRNADSLRCPFLYCLTFMFSVTFTGLHPILVARRRDDLVSYEVVGCFFSIHCGVYR